ncbi:N-formylmethionyl-tRNA deformylase [Fusicatenibacter saccharivorans]|nr:N-formylmethionyl-tRNA deformylase [Fusicatenibacter saccharivorans]
MAVLLCYIDWRKEQRKRLEAEVQKDAEHRELAELLRTLGVKKGTAGISSEPKIVKRVIEPPKSPKTSPGFSELLSHYAMRDQTVFLPKAKAGQVKLEGHLHRKSSKTLETEFKIGIGRMYVLKSISKMVAAVQNMETVSYGAQLSFLHCMDAFQEESRPMVSFLTSYAEETNACFQMASGLYGSYLDDRYLTLTVQNLDEFFLALGEQGFYYDTYLTEEDCWHCRREMPRYEMELLRKADGLEVRMQMDAIMSGRKYLYLVSGQNVIYQVQKEQIEEVRDFMEYIAQRQDGTCVIAKEDIPTFCQGLLPVLEEHFDVKKEEALALQQYLSPQVEFQIYLDAPQNDMITCELLAVYWEKKYNVFADLNNIWQLSRGRDVRKEAAANQLVRACFSAYDARKHQMILQGADEMYEFLSSSMEDLQKLGEIFISDRLKAIRVIPSPKVSVGVSLAENVLELHLNPGNLGMSELAEILSKYDRKKKYYRLRTGEFMDMDEDGIRVLSDLRDNLQISEVKLRSGEITIPKYRALYLYARLKEQDDIQVEKNREFRIMIRNMKTAEENDFELPKNLQAQLREYQKTGFWWLKTLCQNGFGGILADDMGLGKTLQTIAFLLSEMQEAPEGANRRSLIVAPASLVYNWESECARFAPELQTKLVAGTQEQRKEMIRSAGEREILITSYDLRRRDMELYQDLSFFCEIIDEAQFIKNHATQGAKAVKVVKAIDASFRLALTGSPVENQLSELWSIFDYLMPGFLYGYQKFREQFELPIVRNSDEEL